MFTAKLFLSAILLLIFLVTVTTHAQTLDTSFLEVRYQFTHLRDTTQLDKLYKETFVLQIGRQYSSYGSGDIAEADSARKAMIKNAMENAENGGSINMDGRNIKNATKGLLIKNYATHLFTGVVPSFGSDYIIEASQPNLDWQITEETKKVKGFICQKASTNFKGRNYEVWFNMELPFNTGPWKLGGLPGLILEAYDTKRQVIFELLEVNKNIASNNIEISLPAKGVKTTAKAYKQMLDAIRENPNEAINNQMAAMGFKGTINVTMPPEIKKKKLYNNPIELTE